MSIFFRFCTCIDDCLTRLLRCLRCARGTLTTRIARCASWTNGHLGISLLLACTRTPSLWSTHGPYTQPLQTAPTHTPCTHTLHTHPTHTPYTHTLHTHPRKNSFSAVKAQNPERSKAHGLYRYKLRLTKFLGHFGPSQRRKSQNIAKNGPFWPFLAWKLIINVLKPIIIPYSLHNGPYGPKNVTTGSGVIARNFLSTAPPDGIASSGLHAHFSAPKWAFRPPMTGSPPGAHGSPKRHFSARPYLRN